MALDERVGLTTLSHRQLVDLGAIVCGLLSAVVGDVAAVLVDAARAGSSLG